MKRRILNTAKIFHKITHYTFNIFLTIFLFFVIFIFVFVVAIKIAPQRAEDILTYTIDKATQIFHVSHGKIDTKINNGIVKVRIQSFKKQTAKIILEGKNVKITASLHKLWQGTLYEIIVDEFNLKLNKAPENEQSSSNSISKYYVLLPAIKMFIKNFKLNLHGNTVTLEDTKLAINELQYIFSAQTHSKKDGYKLNIFLDRKDLHIYFDGISSDFLNSHTNNSVNFLNFESLKGRIDIDSNKINNFQFAVNGKNITISKGKYVNKDTVINKISANGYFQNGDLLLKFTEAKLFDETKAEIYIKKNSENIDVNVHVEDALIQNIINTVSDYTLQLSKIEQTFQYLKSAMKDNKGIAKTVDVNVHTPIVNQNDVDVKVVFENASFKYNDNFPPLLNANGDVFVNRDYTTVNVIKAISGRNELQNSRAVINHGLKYISLYLDTKGSPAYIANTFNVKSDYTYLHNYFEGKTNLKAFIGIDLTCEDIYACTNVKGNGDFKNVLLPFSSENLDGSVIFTKAKNEDMAFLVKFKNFYYKHFNISEVSGTHYLSIAKKILEFKKIIVKNNVNSEILNVNSIKIPFQGDARVGSVNIKSVNFAGNKFGFRIFNEKKQITLQGSAVHLPNIVEIFNDLKKYYNNNRASNEKRNNSSHTINYLQYDLLTNIENAIFFNNITTPIYINLTHDFKKIGILDLNLNFIDYHYHDFTKNEIMKNKPTSLNIPSLKTLALAFNKNAGEIEGSVKLEGEYNDIGVLQWNGIVSNLKTFINKFKFRPRDFKIKATFFDEVLSFEKIKIYDKNHTISISGKVFTNTFDTKMKIYYTPSKVDIINTVPILSKAMTSVATLGRGEGGLVSLDFDVYGSIFSPEMKFNKSSPVKTIWKLGVVYTLLPLLLL